MKNRTIILGLSIGLLLIMATCFPSYSGNLPIISFPPSITNITICNNQLPYHWNNITCLTAGTYTAVLTGSNGLDSTAILNLSVINVGSSITNAVICDNQLPYTWNGHSYTGSGTYSVTLTSSTGCDSVPILSLTVNHVVTSNTSVNICSNQLPYAWNGNSYNAAGNYNVTLTSIAGCDSVAILHLLVRSISTSTTTKTVCGNQLPYHWNGNSYAAAGNYQVTLTGSNGCDSIAKLQLYVIPVSTSFTSVSVCSNQLPYNWNGQSYATPGNHSVNFVAASGCDSIATLVLTIKPIAQSNTTIRICDGQLPYTWNGNSYTSAGYYSVTLTNAGCDSIANLHLVAVPVLTSNNPVTVCNSQLPYNWNGIDYNTAGTYTASFVNGSGCDSVATLVLSIDTPQLVNGDVVLCEGQLPYTWNGYVFTAEGTYPIDPPIFVDACHSISSFTVSVDSFHIYDVTSVCNNQLPFNWHNHTYNSAGIFNIVLPSTTGGCDTLATLVLSVNQVATSITNMNVCNSQLPFGWNGHNYNSSGTYSVNLVSSHGCDSLATLNLHVNSVQASTSNLVICNGQLPYNWNGHTYSTSGIYTVTLTSSAGCDSIATLNLGVQPFLTSTTNLTVCNNQLPYNWNGNNYSLAGTYTATLTSSGGCDSIATLNLVINNLLQGDTTINICNTQLPFNWNGNVYSTSGNYSVSLISSGGCDSVATLHLVVNGVTYSNTTVTVCNNQLPYSWNGNSYPVAGMYPVTLTSSGGCDSIATLNLIVTDILTSTTNVTICNAQLPFTWNGNSYSVPGTYSVTLSSPGGCDSVPILSLTVVPYFTSLTNVQVCSNQLPYSWNGHSYNAAGIYADTISGGPGCDSIASLHLLVKPVVSSVTNISTCSNQLPFNWNGQSYSTAGTYHVTLTGSNGCDSIATLNLFVKPVVASNNNISVCNNQLPFSWNGNSYNSAGNYSVTLMGSNGCDSIANLALRIKSVSYSTTNIRTCSNQLPVSWNGQQFSTAGTHQVNLVNAAGCDSIATLILSINPVVTGNSIASTCSNHLPFHWNGQSYSTPGVHVVTLQSAAGCDSIATLQLTINPVQSSLTQVIVCNNQLPYFWNGHSYDSSGNFTVTLNSVLGCDSLATLKLIVNRVSTSTTTANVCSAALPYNWNGQSYTTDGIHAVTLTNAAGCDSVATLDLSVQASPGLPIVNSPVKYCQFDSTSALVAAATVSPASLSWFNVATGGIASANAPVPSSALAGTTNYYVSQSSGLCQGPRALITVKVNGKPNLGPDKQQRICFGAFANLNSYYTTNGNQLQWTNGGSLVPNPSAVQLAGIYQLIATTSFGCVDTANLTLQVQPPVVANAGPDANVEPNIPYQLQGSGGGEYQWSPASLLNNPFISSPLASISSNTSFILTVEDEIGCTAFDTVNLRVLNGPTFYVPTAFTPNGDGQNDIFRPTPVGISSLDYFKVFNRYGELVFETHELGKGWDGRYKGVMQNTGNFVWWIKGTDRKGDVKLLKGNVVLIR